MVEQVNIQTTNLLYSTDIFIHEKIHNQWSTKDVNDNVKLQILYKIAKASWRPEDWEVFWFQQWKTKTYKKGENWFWEWISKQTESFYWFNNNQDMVVVVGPIMKEAGELMTGNK